jgi:hypothetical protein
VLLGDDTPKEILAGTQDGEIVVEDVQNLYLPLVLRGLGP